MKYGIICWGNSTHSDKIFRLGLQKKALRIIRGKKKSESFRPLFKNLKILTLTSEYIFSLMCYTMNNFDKFKTNYNIHNLSTRNKNNLFRPVNSLRLFQKGSYYSAIQIYNKLPDYIKLLCFEHKCSSFKNSLK